MDGLISAAFNVVSTKWYEFLKWVYVSDMHIGGPNYELVNIAAYEALPADGARRSTRPRPNGPTR